MSVLVSGVEDYLDNYRQDLDYQLILKNRREAYLKQSMHSHVFSDYLSQITTFKSREVTLNSAVVQIGRRDELTVSQYLDLQYGLRLFFPWKKGPFSFFETMIDSEWRSDLKWQRIRPWCGSLANKVVADVGAHNGYFMFRMAQEQAKLVLGFDPSWKFYCNFSVWINSGIKS